MAKRNSRKEGKTVSVHVRVPRDVWDKLDRARHANERTLSDELNWRLMITFLFNNGVEIIEKEGKKKRW